MSVTYPPFIFGMHDADDGWMVPVQQAGKQGWVLLTEAIGCDPNNNAGADYSRHSNRGFGVLVRINNGYGNDGTIPVEQEYNNFARRCANFVRSSAGARIWIVGNEMNLSGERPHGQPITPELYAQCYQRCREAIKNVPGHADDLVAVGAVGPYNPETDVHWIQYFKHMLAAIRPGPDAIALHAYTHGTDPNLVFSNDREGTFGFFWHFRTYQDFMNVIPAELRNVPVFITEAQPAPIGCDRDGWIPEQTAGWVGNAFREINDWNANPVNQPIQALVLFRWADASCNAWRIADKDWARDAFFATVRNDNYRVRLPAPVLPVYALTCLNANVPTSIPRDASATATLTLRNDGSKTWLASGANRVRLGFQWFPPGSTQETLVRQLVRVSLPADVPSGGSATLTIPVLAPETPGAYNLVFDLVEEGVDYFRNRGATPLTRQVTVAARAYAIKWLDAAVPERFTVDTLTNATLTFRNDGSKTWVSTGTNRVRLSYRWYDLNDKQVLVRQDIRAALPRDVAPGEQVTLGIGVLPPEHPGAFHLRFDLVEEGVTYFQDQGSAPFEKTVAVEGAQDYAVIFGPAETVVSRVGELQYRLMLRNAGKRTWTVTEPNPVKIGYHWFDVQDQPIAVSRDVRTMLMREIAPGDEVSVVVTTVTPDRPGVYRLRWSLVIEGIAWFYDLGARALDVTVEVTV